MDSTKNPISVLNEIMQLKKVPVEYHFINYDQITREFHYRIVLGEFESVGSGQSKKLAQRNAAFKIIQMLSNSGLFSDIIKPNYEVDNAILESNDSICKLIKECEEKLFPTPIFEQIEEYGPPHDKTFTYRCRMSSVVTDGKGSTKKMAKHIAAKKMLENIRLVKVTEHRLKEEHSFDPTLKVDEYVKRSVDFQKQRMDYTMNVSDATKVFKKIDADKLHPARIHLNYVTPENANKEKFEILMNLMNLNFDIIRLENNNSRITLFLRVFVSPIFVCMAIGHDYEALLKGLYYDAMRKIKVLIAEDIEVDVNKYLTSSGTNFSKSML